MPSQAIKSLRQDRMKYAPAGDAGDGPQGMASASGTDGSEANDRQMAHDQVMKGLSILAESYPEAQDLISRFDQMWAKWMGGKAGPGASVPGPAPEPQASGMSEGGPGPQDSSGSATQM